MLFYKRVSNSLLAIAAALILSLFIISNTSADDTAKSAIDAPYTVVLPVILTNHYQSEGLITVNHYREIAGVPIVAEDTSLNSNCFEHARYMAENNILTHSQDPNLPYASPAGQACAERGNAWLGSEYHADFWKPLDSIEGWVHSVGHRLWLLYPTTSAFGFGYYESANYRAGAALDVLTTADFGTDESYTGWPIQYPAPDQLDIPDTQFPITLNWRYFGESPQIGMVDLKTADGTPLQHEATTNLPAGHKGIQITPTEPLPPQTVIKVSVTGTYESTPFTYTWQFTTAGIVDPYP